MTAWQLFTTTWDWEPSVLIGCAGLLVGYLALVRFRWPRRGWYFVAAVAGLLVALVSPIDMLADRYLFSAHMLQHMILILWTPPLMLLGIPEEAARRAMRWPVVRWTEQRLNRPILAWSIGVGTMWLWHWPPLYNAALASPPIHVAEHLSFLTSSTIFWWPVISPLEERRLQPLGAVIYAFGACSAHTVLAILLVFASPGLYPLYLHPVDTLGLLPLIRHTWGMTPVADEQWGGLLMWVPACMVYLTFILWTMARWYRLPEQTPVQAPGHPGLPAAVPAHMESR